MVVWKVEDKANFPLLSMAVRFSVFWFGTKRSQVQILSPRFIKSSEISMISELFTFI